MLLHTEAEEAEESEEVNTEQHSDERECVSPFHGHAPTVFFFRCLNAP